MKEKMAALQKIYHISSALFDSSWKMIDKTEDIKDESHFTWLENIKTDTLCIYIHETKIAAASIPFHHHYLVLGNVFLGEKNERRFWLIKQQLSRSEEKYLRQLPEISLSEFKHLIALISLWLGNNETEIQVIDYSELEIGISLSDDEEYGLLENYRLQEKMMDCIKKGSPEALHQIMHYENFSTKEYTLNEQKINFIKLSALVSKAAYEGGLGLYETDLLINSYLKQLETTNLPQLQKEMLLSVATAVKRSQAKQFKHPLNRKIQEYLQLHLHENINFEDMAQALNISKNYMLSIFKKEANQSLVDYMYTLKIKEAELLLNRNDLSIAQVSTFLGFSSHSYFSKWFKKITGITPKEYINK